MVSARIDGCWSIGLRCMCTASLVAGQVETAAVASWVAMATMVAATAATAVLRVVAALGGTVCTRHS